MRTRSAAGKLFKVGILESVPEDPLGRDLRRKQEDINAVVTEHGGLMALLLSASPLLLGPGLRRTVIGSWFDAINPVSGALNAFDAVIIDSETLSAQGGHVLAALAWLLLAACFSLVNLRRLVR
mgnify:CR=1 FL=1